MKDYKDFYYHEEAGMPVFCYRAGLTVYEEVFAAGRLMSGGFNAAGYPGNLLGSQPVRVPTASAVDASVFSLDVNGQSAEFDTEYLGFTKETVAEENGAECLLVKVRLSACEGRVSVTVCTKLDGTSVLTRWLEVENLTNESLALGNLCVFGGVLEEIKSWDRLLDGFDAKELYSLGYMNSSNWACEGLFSWHPLSPGGTSVLGKYGADRFRHPLFYLRNNAVGGLLACQLAYSGGYEFRFDLHAEETTRGFDSSDRNAVLGGKVMLAGPNPQYVLSPGEALALPEVHLTKLFGGLDDAVNEMNRHVRRSVFTKPAPGEKCALLSAGMGPEHPMTVEGTKFFIDTAARVGAEVFIIDAGWYCPPGKQGSEWSSRTGDWMPDPERYPKGIGEIVDYAHEKGLLFGIWMDAERLGKLSQAAAEHPQWLCSTYVDNAPRSIINMADPEAAAWVEEQVAGVLTQTGAELFRLDYNIAFKEIFVKSEKDGKRFCNTLDYCRAVYRMYDNLRRRFPHVYFENCAGGGGRTDWGMMKNFTHTWVSDWQIAPRSFAITNGMTMALPPETVDRLAGGMCGHTRGSLEFQLRQTLFGKPTTNSYHAVGSEPNEAQLEFVKHCYDIYKDFIRPYAPAAKIYHHTPECFGIYPKGTGILERASEEGDRSLIGVFRLANSGAHEAVSVVPRGIRPEGEYRVIFDNTALQYPSYKGEVIRGERLCREGLRVELRDSLTCELILLEKV